MGHCFSQGPYATYCGRLLPDSIVKRTIYKLAYHCRRSLPSNDNPTLAHIASERNEVACGADTDSANQLL
jgi:hypothetical protein